MALRAGRTTTHKDHDAARLTTPSLLPTLRQILVAGKDIKAMQFKVGLGGKNAKTVSIGELRKKGERFVCG